MTRDSGPIQYRKSAREIYHEASGLPSPKPTDDEIANVIRGAIGSVLGKDPFGEPTGHAALLAAAQAVRALFPTTPQEDFE